MNLVFVIPSWLWLLCLVPLFWFLPQRAVNRRHAAIRSCVVILTMRPAMAERAVALRPLRGASLAMPGRPC